MSFQSWWSKQRREFAQAHQQRKLQAAVRRQKRKVKAEERRRLRAQASSQSWTTRTSQRFSIWRRLQAERRLSRQARWRDKYSWYRWMERRQGLLIGLTFMLLMGVFCIFLFKEAYAPKRKVAPGYGDESAVTVNGRKITMARYIKSLEIAHGPAMLQELTEQEVIRQEAERLKIEIPAEERVRIQDSLTKDPQYIVKYPQIEKAMLLRKIILKETSEARKREVYELFKDDLVTYFLEQLQFDDKAKAEAFREAVRQGTDVEQAAKRYTTQGSERMTMDGFTLGTIRDRFGAAASEALATAKKGDLTRALTSEKGYVVYRVKDIQRTFEAAKPTVESIIVDSETAKVLYRLLSKADIDSFYLERNLLKK